MDSEKCQQVSVTVALPGELAALLVERLNGTSVSDYVRRLIEEDLRKLEELTSTSP